jgi:hypothetical protein
LPASVITFQGYISTALQLDAPEATESEVGQKTASIVVVLTDGMMVSKSLDGPYATGVVTVTAAFGLILFC